MSKIIGCLKTKLVILIFCFLPFLGSLAQGGLPQSEHPRIFLNDEVIQTLKNRMNANTPEWQLFQQYLDAYSAEEPWGGEYLDGIVSFALAYLITDNTAYADRAVHFLDLWVSELDATNPFYVSGDNYAHIYGGVGLGFDWLYNYSGFTTQKKEAVINMMNMAYEYGQMPWDQGGGDFEVDTVDTDQFIGGAKTALFWGIATYGDNASAETMINRSRTIWNDNILNWITKSIGGVWPEGSQYSYNTLYFLMTLIEAERTANGKNIWTENPDINEFTKNCIRSLLWLTPPSNDHILTYNDQEDENTHYWGRRNHFTAITTFMAENLGFTNEAAYGRYWIREFSPNNIEPNIWKLFLWYDREKTHTNYFTQNLPLAHFSVGTDWMFLRSNWTEQTSYSTFSASWTNVDHQFMDGGNFNIWRNGEYLTRQVRHYDFIFTIDGKYQIGDGEASNIMLIESDYVDDDGINSMGSPELFESAGEASITKHRINTSPLFAYSFADLGDSYNRVYDEWGGNSDRVKSYTRQFVQISPDFYFVCDRVRTVDAGWTKYILHSLTEPVINGSLISQTSTSGNQYLHNKILFPKSVTITKINEAEVWTTENGLTEDWMLPFEERKWHVSVQPENSDVVNMLNVIETASGKSSQIEDAQLIESENIFGGQIGNWVVIFSKEETMNNQLNYQITSNSGSINNFVCDLEPNENYIVKLNENFSQSVSTSDDGTLFFVLNDLSGNSTIGIEKNTTGVENGSNIITEFKLFQNYPNPFNPSTKINWQLPVSSFTTIKIYNVLGKEVATIFDREQPAGKYNLTFNGSNLSSGIYFYTISAGDYFEAKRMLLLK
ncbi:MAG: T9SS type A sorting domain-containing protein [Melioribacteraceae bacterium]|nr:T9SS type A sorting domain-containing protein [Melioribacteraceae bacterium]